MGKQTELHKLLTRGKNQRQIDVCIVSETWLSDRTQNLLNIPRYNLVSQHRENRKGGGVCFLLSSHLKYRIRPDLRDNENIISP